MDNKERITLMLDSLAEMQSQRELVKADRQAEIDKVLTQQVKDELLAIDVEFNGLLAAADEKITTLTSAIKDAVVAHGETVRGARVMAIWTKPRVSWDTKKLDGYAAAHPEIQVFRSVGEPSVSIKAV